MSFEQAVAYCAWYAALSKKPFRLPTEWEWEFACRGATRSRWFFGEDPAEGDRFVWHLGNSGDEAHPIEMLRANPAGLHDLLGNVWEWTTPEVGVATTGVLRGGSFRTAMEEMGGSVRFVPEAGATPDDVGFRIVRAL